MSLSVERYAGDSWEDITGSILRLTHSLTVRELEKLEMEMAGVALDVGERVRLLRNSTPVFEGVIYERERIRREIAIARCLAYSELILYENHIIYRNYTTGTTAGEIIRDLAELVEGVETSNVEDGPALKSDWLIQNETSLEIMRRTAKGTNHLLRMKPGRKLYFTAKTIGTPNFTLEESSIISAQYTEDRWRLRNKVIYVGSGGTILAEASEPPADLPLIVHDPFLTDPEEAMRRATIRLEMCREYGRQLNVELHGKLSETLNMDVGATVRVNLPSLGIANTDMTIIEITHQPQQMRTHLTLGGRLEYLEQILGEIIAGDTASLFGQQTSIPELLTTITKTLKETFKLQSRRRTIRLEYKPPIRMENASNIIIDSNGYASLTAGATQGSFECSCLPASGLFERWLRIHYVAEGGDVSVGLYRADESLIAGNIPADYDFQYYPSVSGL